MFRATMGCSVPLLLRLKLHHLGVAVATMAPAVEEYAALGYRPVGAPVYDAGQRATVLFLADRNDRDAPLAAPLVELLSPEGQGGPVAGILRRGLALYHVCYEVIEMAPALESLRTAGWLLIRTPQPAPALGGREVAWLYSASGALLEVLDGYPR